ncbi:MAG: GTPase [Ornithinimicrobium sp.]
MAGRSTKRTAAEGGKSLVWRADQLSEALQAGGAQLDPVAVEHAHQMTARVRERWAIKGGHTVVSLAGATGSGKSSLFNAMVNDDVATIGARRPTTATATAAIWGEQESHELLDWLAVPTRHHMATQECGPDGLVLIDLPDFDSTQASHRVEADRVLERSDVFVWVTDPQKYADARLHEDYLAKLQDHQSVMVVVLNQIDRIPMSSGVAQISDDLRALIAADGAGDFDIITTSALTRSGIEDLRGRIAEVVAAKNAAEHRLTGDIIATSRQLLEGVAKDELVLGDKSADQLNGALGRAAGIPVVLQAVQQDYLRQSKRRAGWPFTRWVSGLRASPLRRLRLGAEELPSNWEQDVRTVLGRSSLPPATPAARAQVEMATRDLADVASAGLPVRWRQAVDDAATPNEASLTDALDQAVINTPLRLRDPLWWSVWRVAQMLLAVAVLAGAAWLTALAASGWLQIDIDAPSWGPVPIPLALFGGGILGGLVLAILARSIARGGAVRRRAEIEKRMYTAISAVAKQHVREPVSAVLQRHKQTRQQLQAAAEG